MSGRLDGQVALVTGGGRGIGRAIGAALAAAGSRVALAARPGAELDEDLLTLRLRKRPEG